jgi:hypothetical protein
MAIKFAAPMGRLPAVGSFASSDFSRSHARALSPTGLLIAIVISF